MVSVRELSFGSGRTLRGECNAAQYPTFFALLLIPLIPFLMKMGAHSLRHRSHFSPAVRL